MSNLLVVKAVSYWGAPSVSNSGEQPDPESSSGIVEHTEMMTEGAALVEYPARAAVCVLLHV